MVEQRLTMKITLRAIVFCLLLGAALPSASAQRFVSGQSADVVLGQPDFFSIATPVTASRFDRPASVAVDPTTGKVFVADYGNNRVLRFSSAAAARIGALPEAVFGQPGFGSEVFNWSGAPAADTMGGPLGITVDAQGRLWVADTLNNRVLMFEAASLVGPTRPFADRVLGQPNFATNTAGTTAAKMNNPYGVSVGPGGTLWVGEFFNRRVLRFDNASEKANGANADGVLGKFSFTSSTAGLTQSLMSDVAGVHADASGRLWVSDLGNRRVLRFDNAAEKADGATADGVIGQPDFSTATTSLTAGKFAGPHGLSLDAAGALWVPDPDYGRVQRFPNAAAIGVNGTPDLVLGTPDFTTLGNASTSARTAAGAFSVAPAPGGRVFVADFDGNRVLRFSPIPKATFTVRVPKTTTAPSVILNGTAANATSVQVKVGKAAAKTAKLTGPRWTFRVKLAPGRNILVVRASGPGGDATPKRLIVTRR